MAATPGLIAGRDRKSIGSGVVSLKFDMGHPFRSGPVSSGGPIPDEPHALRAIVGGVGSAAGRVRRYAG